MRSILFKAKKLSDGKWVKGSLVKTPFGTFIEWYEDSISNKREVYTDTVCQSTGLKDCEGKDIWEGDMLSNVTNDSPDGIVVFKYGAFSLLAKNGRDFCVALTYLLSEKDSLNRFKVVGNKFDKKK